MNICLVFLLALACSLKSLRPGVTSLVIGDSRHRTAGYKLDSLSLHPSQPVSLADSPSFPQDMSLPVYYVMVSCLTLIGLYPTRYTPLRTNTCHSVSGFGVRDAPLAEVFGRNPRAQQRFTITQPFPWRNTNVAERALLTISTEEQSIWSSFAPRRLFNDYHFVVQLIATSLMMAVRNLVENSSALTPYQSPRSHDSKIPLSIHQFTTGFLLPSSGQHQIASPVDR